MNDVLRSACAVFARPSAWREAVSLGLFCQRLLAALCHLIVLPREPAAPSHTGPPAHLCTNVHPIATPRGHLRRRLIDHSIDSARLPLLHPAVPSLAVTVPSDMSRLTCCNKRVIHAARAHPANLTHSRSGDLPTAFLHTEPRCAKSPRLVCRSLTTVTRWAKLHCALARENCENPTAGLRGRGRTRSFAPKANCRARGRGAYASSCVALAFNTL